MVRLIDDANPTRELDRAAGLRSDPVTSGRIGCENMTALTRGRSLSEEGQLQKLMDSHDLNSHQKEMVNAIFDRLPGSDRMELIHDLLNKKDPSGKPLIEQNYGSKNILEHLGNFADPDPKQEGLNSFVKARGFSREAILTDLVKAITDSSAAYQSNKATCMSCGLEYGLIALSKHPSDIARLVACTTQLAATGEFKTSKTTFKINSPLSNDPRDKRSSVSSILQQAFMNEGSDGGYDAQRDLVSTNGKQPHPGLYSRQVEKLYENFTERPFTRVDQGVSNYEAAIEKSLKDGTTNVACISGIGTGEHSMHAVNVVDIKQYGNFQADKDYIYFRNPWGNVYLRDGQGGAKLVPGLEKEAVYKLPRSEFLSRTTYVMVEGGSFGTTTGVSDEREQPMKFTTVLSENAEVIAPKKQQEEEHPNYYRRVPTQKHENPELERQVGTRAANTHDDSNVGGVLGARANADRLKVTKKAEEIT